MARDAGSFRRRGARHQVQPSVLVICEDSKSARQYLQDAARYFRVHVKVEIMHIGKTDPKGIVSAAIERSERYDKVFCSIDRDSHQGFQEALAMARRCAAVRVIASYPCFEFWYLLHFCYTRRAYTSVGSASAGERLISHLRSMPGMSDYAKGSDKCMFDFLLPLFLQARARARRVWAEASRDGEMNPSTEVHELLDYFESLALPRQS